MPKHSDPSGAENPKHKKGYQPKHDPKPLPQRKSTGTAKPRPNTGVMNPFRKKT